MVETETKTKAKARMAIRTPDEIIADAAKHEDKKAELESLREGIQELHVAMQSIRAEKLVVKARIQEIEGPAPKKTRKGTQGVIMPVGS